MHRHAVWFALTLLGSGPSDGASAPAVVEPLGPEFFMTTGGSGAEVAIDENGTFLASSYVVFTAQGFLRGGGSENLEDPFDIESTHYLELLALGADEFLVGWRDVFDDDSLRFRRSRSDGTPLSADEVLPGATAVDNPEFARLPGAYWVAWHQAQAIRARRYPDGGEPGPILTIANEGAAPKVAFPGDGLGLAVWHGTIGCGTAAECILGRLIDTLGQPVGDVFPINEPRTGEQAEAPAIAAYSDGFVVSWTSDPCDATAWPRCIKARRVASDGQLVGQEIRVDDPKDGANNFRSAIAARERDFIVSWISSPGAPEPAAVDARVFSTANRPLTEPFRVNTSQDSPPQHTNVAINDSGQTVIVWSNDCSFLRGDEDPCHLTGRRFLVNTTIFTDGFESGDTSAWAATVP